MTTCLNCGKEVTAKYSKKFCNRSCSAQFNNKNRAPRTEESKAKTRSSVINKLNSFSDDEYKSWLNAGGNKNRHPKTRNKIQEIVGPFTKVYLCKCKFSGSQFYSTTVKTIHPNLKRNRSEYAYSCKFSFSISSFPWWFVDASKLIKEFGWYSTPGSRRGVKNTNGISRDHMYSVNDGWINNIPPEILRHPANCELVPHKLNQSKNKNSKISIEELYERIKRFNELASLYGNAPHSSGLESDASL